MHKAAIMNAKLATVVLLVWAATAAQAADADFARQVNLERVRLMAVQNDGRVKTFDTLAREIVREVTGTPFFKNPTGGATFKQDPVFTYLDMMFDSASYRDVPHIYIKKKHTRLALARAAANRITPQEQERIITSGLVSAGFLQSPAIQAKLDDLSRNVRETAKDVDRINNALTLSTPRALKTLLRAVPPPGSTSIQERWLPVSQLDRGSPHDAVHAGMDMSIPIAGMNPDQQKRLSGMWADAAQAWRSGDAAAAGAALDALAAELATVAPAVYPQPSKLAMEHWYYKYHKMTWTWWFYMLAVVFLLMGIVYRWPRAWWTGAGVYAIAFLLHTVATGVRWYLAGRIPNANMFEAVIAAAWFGAAIAIFLELGPALSRSRLAWRASAAAAIGGLIVFVLYLTLKGLSFSAWQQWGLVPTASLIIVSVGCMGLIAAATGPRIVTRGLAMLGAAVMAMIGLMCGRFIMADLSDISNTMPVLNDIWLYIHTNMIIASYMLIGMAYVLATMYVVGRLLTRPTQALWLSMLLPTLVIPLPGVLWLLRGQETEYFKTMLPAWAPFAAVVAITLLCMAVRRVFGAGFAQRWYSAWEGLPLGAAGIVGAGGRTVPPPAEVPPAGPSRAAGLARVLDGSTMLLLELSFITLWVGIITGAIWADHSWGRPWGWDPKEVFALNTWIIFLILVHVRLKVREKALWTAVLTVVGMSVMMFNWIVVNFFITGLHSYAG